MKQRHCCCAAQNNGSIRGGLISLLINTSDAAISCQAAEVSGETAGGEEVNEQRGEAGGSERIHREREREVNECIEEREERLSHNSS